jgi:AAA domain
MKTEPFNPQDYDYIPPGEPVAPGIASSPREPEQNPVRILTYAEMVSTPQGEWLVYAVLPLRAKSVLFGPSNSFKTFHATDLGCSVSTGVAYHGMATKKCKVIYLANEGAKGVGRKRIPAWMAYHRIPPNDRDNIFLVPTETILPNETSRNNLLARIRAIVEPDEDFFLIIDVMRGTMTGSENDDEAAHAWTSAVEILIAEGATVLAITHSPYSEDGRMRGHSHLWGSFDTRLQAEGDKEKRTSLLKAERHKEHDSRGQWGFRLEEQEIDEHPGEFSLVPRLDGNIRPKTRGPAPKQRSLLLEVIAQAIDEAGVPVTPFTDGPAVKAVSDDIARSR